MKTVDMAAFRQGVGGGMVRECYPGTQQPEEAGWPQVQVRLGPHSKFHAIKGHITKPCLNNNSNNNNNNSNNSYFQPFIMSSTLRFYKHIDSLGITLILTVLNT